MKQLKKIIHKFFSLFNLKITKKNYGLNDFPIVEATKDEIELLNTSSKYSMTSLPRRWALINAIKQVKNQNIEGDFVECGVWKGGNLIIYNNLNKKYQLQKNIFGYDTFSGMSEPTIHDNNFLNINAKKEWESNNNNSSNVNNSFNCYSSLEEVKKNILHATKNSSLENTKLILGKVEETLDINENLPQKISILRLDTDWYESTKKELEILYPKLVKGGILIIDDYGQWKGSKKAVDEYFKNENVIKHFIDFSCRMIIK
ncbi:TylF/MycF/NovP-related O-methyltransferase [Candidatus Pelagibacter sp. Uisw_092]|uniref:TylF/MycF/NovP-related O-methyltransferase n=1 Tax=Candidatus Pelagibacter sp. Uisw_092 TaxID=3230979 RepID=UPI0039EB9752